MDAANRAFFTIIRQAIVTNPFGRSRPELDRAATGLPSGTAAPTILATLVAKNGRMLEDVLARHPEQTLGADDRQLLQFAKLFQLFHIYSDAFDTHISHQLQNPGAPCRLVFARDILGALHSWGFSESESHHLLGLFFQMRRAYSFISAIAGHSESVLNLRRELWNNIFTSDIELYDTYLRGRMEDFSTMLLGETGTGKGMAAAAIGRAGYIPYDSARERFCASFTETFLAINLSQFSEQLIESELFGHQKGAFTGAVEPHQGVFARCSPYGAIFLDELGDITVPVQIKLLQVLQERFFSPVGSHSRERFAGRVIGATNRPLNKLRSTGQFRDDFYYRLCSDVITVPPLRQRLQEEPGELLQLLAVTLQRIIGRPAPELAAEMAAYIEAEQPPDYPWPGNIRELEQCTRQLLLRRQYSWQASELSPDTDSLPDQVAAGTLTVSELNRSYCRQLYAHHGSYEAVARLTALDRRTVKKYIQAEARDE